MVGSRLNGVRLTGASLERLRLIDVILDDCELSGATLEGASLARVQFNRCRLSGLVGAGVKAQDVRFVDCKMDGSNFRMTAWDRSEWVDCDLRDADFYAAKLAGCAFRHCTLVGLELSKAGCDALDLRGSTVDGIKGAASLAGCVIGSDQVFPLARCLLGALRIRVEDEPPA